jgi:hypothetical protein
MIYHILRRYGSIPSLYHHGVHFSDIFKGTITITDDIVVAKMIIAGEQYLHIDIHALTTSLMNLARFR